MKKRLMKDGWFQMFAAVGGVALVVSILGGVSTRHAPPPAPAAAAAPAAAPSMAASAAAVPDPVAAAPAGGPITPAAPSSSDLATYSAVTRSPGALIMAPSAPPPPPPSASPPQAAPQITLTGTGVGNTAGIVGGQGGGFGSLLGGLLGTPRATQQLIPIPAYRVTPAKPGVFTVGPSGTAGIDTSSLRDAAYSASNGDLILVKPGTYEGPVEVANKSVRIRGTGAYPAAVVVRWTGPGAALSVREGSLDVEKIRVERGAFHEPRKSEPGGALYASASVLTLRKVELDSSDSTAPPLIVEEGGKPSRVTAEDSRISTIGAGALIRGAVKATFTRMTFHATKRPLAAWIDAAIEMRDCVFLDTGEPSVIHAYEGARVTLAGKQKPYISGVRGAEATGFEDSFGGARAPAASGAFARDIFRRGRRPGTLP